MKLYKLLFLMVVAVFASCSHSDTNSDGSMGQVNLNLAADASTIPLKTKAAEPALTPDMFKIRIENIAGETLKSWSSFTNLPSPIKINAGSYRFVAWYGSSELPAWDVPYYEGKQEFQIEANENKNINITCQLAAVKVQVKFDESFDAHYSSYSVDIRTGEDVTKFLNYDTATQSRAAYFTPGKLYIRFRLTAKSDGQTYFFTPSPIAQTIARESYTFNMSAKVNQGIGSIIINTDETTNDKEPIEIVIPR